MDAWASFYDYASDDLAVASAVGSARASSELDHAEPLPIDDRLGALRQSALRPDSVVFSALQPMQPENSPSFLPSWHDHKCTSTPTHLSSVALDHHHDHDPSSQLRYPRFDPGSRLSHSQEVQKNMLQQETNFSYNVTPPLALVERHMARTWIGLTWGEIKLLALAGAGFFMDSYDLFIINMVYPILLLAYYPLGTSNIEWGLSGGVLKASASMGNVVGQLLFGFLGDFWGRSVLYGKELMLAMLAIILMISAPDTLRGQGVTIWIAAFRFLMGIGIGGDYPLSATVVADRSSTKTRGLLLSLIFSNQGWGALAAALSALAVIASYSSSILSDNLSELSGAWRILLGLPLAPGFVVLYFRLTLIESARFVQARYLQDHDDVAIRAAAAGIDLPEISATRGLVRPTSAYAGTEVAKQAHLRRKHSELPSCPSSFLGSNGASTNSGHGVAKHHFHSSLPRRQLPFPRELREAMRKAATQSKGLSFNSIGVARNDFWEYFSEWRHLKVLLGTSISWFLVDITFYGINLNQSGIFALIGYTQGSAWHRIYKQALGNLIVVLAGFLPGYYLTVALIEVIGRKKIQLFGFAANALLFLVLALSYNTIIHQAAPFFAVFVLLQLSFNFGSNSTTFVVPAEVFPTRVRATAHGFCAAMGKLGSIVSSLGFSILATSPSFGHTGIFWIFLGVSLLGFVVTLLLVPETKGYDADMVDRQEMLDRPSRA